MLVVVRDRLGMLCMCAKGLQVTTRFEPFRDRDVLFSRAKFASAANRICCKPGAMLSFSAGEPAHSPSEGVPRDPKSVEAKAATKTVMSGFICELVGILRDVQYQRCRLILQELSVEHAQFLPRIHGMTEIEYLEYLDSHKDVIPKDKRGHHHQSTHPFAIINGDRYVSGEEGLLGVVVEKTQLSRSDVLAIAAFGGSRAILEYNKQLELAEETLQAKAETAAKQALFRIRQLSGNQYVYFIFDVDGVALPRVEIELFHRVCPNTCKNFIAFCQRKVPDIQEEERMLGYKDNVVHRVVRGGWIQAGDVSNNGQGDGPCRSLFGRQFADESFAISHNAAGILVCSFCVFCMRRSADVSNGDRQRSFSCSPWRTPDHTPMARSFSSRWLHYRGLIGTKVSVDIALCRFLMLLPVVTLFCCCVAVTVLSSRVRTCCQWDAHDLDHRKPRNPA